MVVQGVLGDASEPDTAEPQSGTPTITMSGQGEEGPPEPQCFHLMALLGQSSKFIPHLFRSSLLSPGPKTLQRVRLFLSQPMARPEIWPLETVQVTLTVGPHPDTSPINSGVPALMPCK